MKRGKKKEEAKGDLRVDFRRPLPYWECNPVAYEDYEPLMGLREYLDRILEGLFEKEIDSGNANVLDGTIDTYARKALEDLKRQRQDHLVAIDDKVTQRGGVETRFRGAYMDALKKLEEFMPEFEELEADYKGTRKRRNRHERYQ